PFVLRSPHTASFLILRPTPPALYTFPTRRSSDLSRVESFWDIAPFLAEPPLCLDLDSAARALRAELERAVDAALVSDVPLGVLRSEEHTLNSSHRTISYAVFCLKKKNVLHAQSCP